MSSQPSAARISLLTVSALALGVVSYACYFDYKRRNDPVFRKKLLKEQKKVQKVSKRQEQVGQEEIKQTLQRALTLINAEQVPNNVEVREQYFMEQVALGEQLAARGGEFHIASAISFFKALKVYPAPNELIQIYQKTQPPQVFDLVMELVALEINNTATAALSRSTDPRDRHTDAILTEIESPSPSASSPPATATGTTSENGSIPSTGSSFVQVEADPPEEVDA